MVEDVSVGVGGREMIAKRQHKGAIVQSAGRHPAHFSFAIKDMCASAPCLE